MIKQLEWALISYIGEPAWYGAETPFGGYEVRYDNSGNVRIRFCGDGRFQPFNGDMEAAKAEAQRHFEERVKSLLVEPAPLPQIAARFMYTNYKGEREEREVYPLGLFYGSTPYHRETQWFMRAFDISRNAERDFALKDIGADTMTPKITEALAPLVAIADAYDANDLDDEARKFWTWGENTTPPEQIELYNGRGGKRLLTLADCLKARELVR